MKKLALFVMIMGAFMIQDVSAKDIRVVEVSTGGGMRDTYDSSIQSILKTISGVSRVVSDVANLVLTITYDADIIGVDDIIYHINDREPRFEAKQKGEPKTKRWIKAERKRDKAEEMLRHEREEAERLDHEREHRGGPEGPGRGY